MTRLFSFWILAILLTACHSKPEHSVDLSNAYPWVIVEFDFLERTPAERISMLNNLGFTSYAYDWNIENLEQMSEEFALAQDQNIEIIAVWLWLNAKRDSTHQLHESNEKMIETVKAAGLSTTFWVSFNDNFFEGQTQQESVEEAAGIIKIIYQKASAINCDVALYNHRGWFGNPYNQLEIIDQLKDLDLSIVYNFHHAHHYLEGYPDIVKEIMPYLANVNLNGMNPDGPEIITLGKGIKEEEMIDILFENGYRGPWGLLGHVREEDVQKVLERNIKGYEKLVLNR